MSLTLGEKLQQAREARGITISEVAEQTRISSLYLEAIENNDYRTLPGGIFNKGFVKSYARYVGLDEHEALADYSRLLIEQQGEGSEELKVYKPEVLTDAHTRSSSITTIVLAVIILGLMTWGILALVNYLQETKNTPPANNSNTNPNANTPVNSNTPIPTTPTMNNLKVEVKAVGGAVSLSSTSDGTSLTKLVAADTSVTFEPKEKLKLSFSKSLAQNVQLSINGKPILLPTTTAAWKRNVEIEITESNLAQIWQSGQFASNEAAAPTPAKAAPQNIARPTATPAAVKTPAANTSRGNVNR